MRANVQQITFNAFDAMKCADENEQCHAIGFLDSAVEEEFAKFFHIKFDDDGDPFELAEAEMTCEFTETKKFEYRQGRSFEFLNWSNHSFKPPRPSIEDLLTLELKHLPLHLEYAYLGDNNTLPVKSKKPLGWTIADIKGIMHKILLEDCRGNSIEQ
ncbi:Retrovirus-related Pol polyprotein from transposon opus [Gossypium australe]|uniref:Retrovirus-related Pol polyprotein from transposon opus n=1 Tax=Gossypium australe TaxID=47621 RepID=A0A5B6VKN3_9ROSI|nr:Retrovirus-related Pol polyprotein from transposon opus [Gossypium australe]